MNENEVEEVSPEEFTKLYMSMTTEERELFWKMFAEGIKQNNESQCKSEEKEF